MLKISPTAHADIWKRIQALGPEYERDFLRHERQHGPVILIREPIGLVIDGPEALCEICKERHDNDALTDICKACEARINEEGSP